MLPVIERELRVASRKTSTYRRRVLVALFGVLLASFFLLLAAFNAAPRFSGSALFMTMGTLAFLFSLLEGMRHAADCISAEKREGTLGLMFLTDLNGFDIVLGKLSAIAVRSLHSLLSFFPVLAIALLLGGVTGGEFFRMVLVMLNALFLSLGVGIGVSALTRRAHIAISLTFVALTSLTVVPFILRLITQRLGQDSVSLWIGSLSPLTSMSLVDEGSYLGNVRAYWISIAAGQVFGWGMIALAARSIRFSWQERGVQSPEQSNIFRKDHAIKRAAFRKKMLAVNPILWLSSRQPEQTRLSWSFSLLIVLIATPLLYFESGAVGSNVLVVITSLALKVWLVIQACTPFAQARETGAIELWLVTPLRLNQVVNGQILALLRIFGLPVFLLCGWQLLANIFSIMADLSQGNFDSLLQLFLVGMFQIGFLVDVASIALVGMWLGLREQTLTRAIFKTLGLTLVLPTFLQFCCIPSLVINVVLGGIAYSRIYDTLKSYAATRFGTNDARSNWWYFGGSSTPSQPPIIPRG
ncbi:MAG: hypothetical protein SFY81_09625 [Verrucomicrobiota bacterium]|nr:hypothetical protein [Verrucomicrobiota bacterium]